MNAQNANANSPVDRSNIFEVTASLLNVRAMPKTGEIITQLEGGHWVEKIGDPGVEGWVLIETTAGNAIVQGYVATQYILAIDPKPAFKLPLFKDLRNAYKKVAEFITDFQDHYAPEDLPAFNEILTKYDINKNTKRLTHFLAQLAHESQHFRRTSENLNYSAEGLWRVFRKYFDSLEHAQTYERQPERIANRVYADRIGNGDEASGDGWRYRGRGFIQLTGKDNYRAIGDRIGVDLVNNPDMVAEDHRVALLVSADYWDSRGLNKFADRDDLDTITKRINGGFNGLEDRRRLLARARSIWGK